MNRVKVLEVPGQVNGLKCLERRAKIRVASMRLTTAIKILAMVRNLTYLKLTYNLPAMYIIQLKRYLYNALYESL